MRKTVTHHCAFEDSEGWFVDPKEFSETEAVQEAVARNVQERGRLKGRKKPDAVWVVVKAETTYSVVANPGISTKPTKKVVRRPLKKK
jgi:hypothetical protein